MRKPYRELIDSICVPSLFVVSWTHQLLDLALKSPSRTVKAGSLLLILHEKFSRDRKKCSNSRWLWLGEQYKVITYPFFSNDNFTCWTFWKIYITHLPYRNLIIVIDTCTSSFSITGMICSYYRVSFNE